MKRFARLWKKINWKLTLLLLISAITMIAFGVRKEGYHVDEIYSYGLANSEYLPFMHFGDHDYDVKDWMLEYGAGESPVDLIRNLIRDFNILKECDFRFRESIIYQDYLLAQANSADTRTTTWVSGQDYQDYLAVSESNTFNYASVYYNQRGDVHPPLYYILLHTICSVFQGVFSKWFALSINIVFLLLALIVLYRMMKEYLGGETAALVAVCAYGLSGVFMSNAMFLRMYAMLTFMVLACCYVHLQIAGDNFRLKGKNRRKLMLVLLGGFLTQYYFVIYAAGAALVFLIWMLALRKGREAVSYLLTLAGSAGIGLCVWPYALRHVFSGYRGQEALEVILEKNFHYIKIKVMFNQIADQLYGGRWWIILVCLCVTAGIFIRKRGKVQCFARGTLVAVPILLYIVIVAQIAPDLIERYVMCTYPFWSIFVVGTAVLLVRELPGGKPQGKGISGHISGRWKDLVLVLTGVLLLAYNNCYFKTPSYLYQGGQETVKVPENTDCVYVIPGGDWNESAVDSTILAQCRNVAVVYHSDIDCLTDTYEYQTGDFLMVVIHKEINIDSLMTELDDILGLEGLTEVDRQESSTTTRILLRG